MTADDLKKLLDELRALPSETEWVEFKEAKTAFSFKELGQYFSALSNEANLKHRHYGWLVFGIEDSHRNIVGTLYRQNRAELDSLKLEIGNKTTGRITFTEIYELYYSEGRVIMFQIPAAPKGIPVAWEGHYYGRDGESLVALNLHEIEQIRHQGHQTDWSSEICDGATIDDLDRDAVAKARERFREKYQHLNSEVNAWDDATFLNKAKITIQGNITRTAIILLGKNESEHFLGPYIAKISWILKDEHNVEKDYEHFGPPFLLNIDMVLAKIRNLKYRHLPDNTLFPIEINQYDVWVIREALNNCIAHQDYELKGRISVVERPDELIFTNPGSFMPGSVEEVIERDSPPERYRNQFLADAMVKLKMIDTIGSGIKRMFLEQKRRFFPLPDYDLTNQEKVVVKLQGKILDKNYTRLLIDHTELELATVMLLDKVQKGMPLSREEHQFLKNKKLVEGRYPNIFVSHHIASVTGERAKYIKNRGFDKKHYKTMVIDYIKEFDSASRQDIDTLLVNKLPDVLSEEQKKNKIGNLIFELSRKDKVIENRGSDKKPCWVLVK